MTGFRPDFDAFTKQFLVALRMRRGDYETVQGEALQPGALEERRLRQRRGSRSEDGGGIFGRGKFGRSGATGAPRRACQVRIIQRRLDGDSVLRSCIKRFSADTWRIGPNGFRLFILK